MDGGGAAAVEVARRVAEEVLFPAAIAVDRADAVPVAHLGALAEAGLYGVAGPVEAGGADLGLPAFCSVVEALAGGCQQPRQPARPTPSGPCARWRTPASGTWPPSPAGRIPTLTGRESGWPDVTGGLP